ELVRVALRLQQLLAQDPARSPDDAVARARQRLRVGIDRARARPELADEAVVEASKPLLAGLAEVQVPSEEPPEADREPGDAGVLDLAEPCHPPGEWHAGHAVRQQEAELVPEGRAAARAVGHRANEGNG